MTHAIREDVLRVYLKENTRVAAKWDGLLVPVKVLGESVIKLSSNPQYAIIAGVYLSVPLRICILSQYHEASILYPKIILMPLVCMNQWGATAAIERNRQW